MNKKAKMHRVIVYMPTSEALESNSRVLTRAIRDYLKEYDLKIKGRIFSLGRAVKNPDAHCGTFNKYIRRFALTNKRDFKVFSRTIRGVSRIDIGEIEQTGVVEWLSTEIDLQSKPSNSKSRKRSGKKEVG